jgi:hypothetical protein
MKKILLAGLLSGLLSSPAFAAIKEVVKEASGSGPTQHQAISEALLIAVQSVNGASVSSQMNYEETVSLSVNNQGWSLNRLYKISICAGLQYCHSKWPRKIIAWRVLHQHVSLVRNYQMFWGLIWLRLGS